MFHLYVDDSGSRIVHITEAPKRTDGINCFGLGGVLVDTADLSAIFDSHGAFMARWGLTAPLHSTKIRGRREAFSWLRTDKDRAQKFYDELNTLVVTAPIMSISCVVDRPGYIARYADKYEQPWLLCQTAFAILMERAAKYARDQDAKLIVYFEEAGRKEDRGIMAYAKSLKVTGMPFPGADAAGYDGLRADDFRNIVLGEPNRITKKVPMVQIADLVLYAMVKGGYDPTYRPFQDLHTNKRIIDAVLPQAEIPTRGVKYSCFDTKKAQV